MPIALINILVALVIIGLVLWGIEQIPMDDTIRKVIKVVVVVVVCVWLLYFLLGMLPSGSFLPYRR